MQKQSLGPTVRVSRVLLTLVLLLPTLLSASILGHLKFGKHKHPKEKNLVAAKTPPGMPLRMRQAESVPGRVGSGEPEGGPLAFEREKLANRAYPGTDIPIALTKTTQQHFARVQSESEAGTRGRCSIRNGSR